MEEEKKFTHPIDSINERIYARDAKSSKDIRHSLEKPSPEVTHTWGQKDSLVNSPLGQKKSLSFFQILFTGAFIFALGAAGFLWYSTIQGRSTLSNENIAIAISSKQFVDGGEDLDFRVNVSNANAAGLELVDMVVEYPLSSDAEGRDIERERRTIGNISARAAIDEVFDIKLFGSEGDQREITVTLEYRVAGSNAIFTKEESVLVGIRSAPAVVLIDAPERLVAGQEVTLKVTVVSNAQESLQETGLIMEYPSGFEYQSASISPNYGTSTWNLGPLNPGEIKEISITGRIQGDIGVSGTFRARIGERNTTQASTLAITYSSRAHVITLEDSFLAVGVELDRSTQSSVAYDSNDTVRGNIEVTNTLKTPLADVRIIVELVGDIFNPETVRVVNGRYDSNNQQYIWTQDSNSGLATLLPGQEKSVGFSFDLTSVEGLMNPSMDLVIHLRATGQDGTIYEAQDITSRQIVLNSDAVLDRQTLHASGPLPNTGSVPPSVGQATTYTIHWDIHNSANALTDTTVSARLPQYVSWTGQVSPQSERITYNTETRMVTWDVGSVARGTGFDQSSRKVYFQVSLTPSSADIGQRLELTRDVTLKANDAFTKQALTSVKSPHTTRLQGDSIEENGFVE